MVSLYFVEYAFELAAAVAKTEHVHLVLLKKRVQETVGETIFNSCGPNLSYSLLSSASLKHPSIFLTIAEIYRIVQHFKPDVIHIQECYKVLNGVFLLFKKCTIFTTVHDVVCSSRPSTSENAKMETVAI